MIDVADRLDAQRAWYLAPGALALVRADGEEWTGTSGAADVDGTPITVGSTFRIASITKPIVAALVLDAVRRGELSLDDVVDDVLPGVVDPQPPITVRMLLNHTSGLWNVDDGDPVADIANLTDPGLQAEAADLMERYAAGEQVIAPDRLLVALAETHERYFAPGDGYHYSNANYQVAAMVLEEATGRTLAQLLQERLVEPLGLHDTTIAPPHLESPDVRGYGTNKDDGSLVDLTDDLVAFGNGGSGGIVSSAGDLLTLMQAIAAGDVVDGEILEQMKAPTAQSDGSYGLGLATYYLSCGTFLGHEGGVNGTASIAIVTTDGSAGTVVALNMRDGSDPRLPALADDLLCHALGTTAAG